MSSRPTSGRQASGERPPAETPQSQTMSTIPPTSLSNPEPVPIEKADVHESETTIPNVSQKQTPPTLQTTESTQNEADVQMNQVSSVADGSAETQPSSNKVRWTIPGLPRDSIRSSRTLQLPVRRFGSRDGNASMRNDPSHGVRETLQGKKSKWLAELCKNLK
ncbi:uncharacterized protein FSUBG_13900 [Fusarium subglutinans]|uniref:Uncharacterized protein n=1 Tax=Gibberella subglutinans TaxID=42677 RepID=A0A8H5KLN5_GIBSU|nr:uncharacterized protein FSUBG_13900 [Fusarium subglutinans]KAF5575518.1 hypothetical protein FSUBG_13900 [Fusarium subglutinans]